MKDVLFKPFTAIHRRSSRLFAGLPVDLVGVTGFVLVASVFLAVVNVSSPVVRAVVGAPLLFFVPGYVTVSLLFPRAAASQPLDADSSPLIAQTQFVSDLERGALAFGLSVALLPLLGLVLAATPWGFTTTAAVGTVSGFALVVTCLAIARRLAVPPSERYSVGFSRRLEATYGALFGTNSTMHAAVNVVLALSILIAVTTVGYALIAPQSGEEYTDLQLLTEDESGELVAADYPAVVGSDETVSITAAIDNREGESTAYTLVVQEQWVDDGEVLERTTLDSTDVAVADGETEAIDLELSPRADDGDVRISVLLYDGEVPETPTNENAYRDTFFWTSVTGDSEIGSDVDGGDETDDVTDTGTDDDGTDDGGDGGADDEDGADDEGGDEEDDADDEGGADGDGADDEGGADGDGADDEGGADDEDGDEEDGADDDGDESDSDGDADDGDAADGDDDGDADDGDESGDDDTDDGDGDEIDGGEDDADDGGDEADDEDGENAGDGDEADDTDGAEEGTDDSDDTDGDDTDSDDTDGDDTDDDTEETDDGDDTDEDDTDSDDTDD